MVALCQLQVLVGQRYSSDVFCRGEFFHHGLRDCTSGFVVCQLHAGCLVLENFCVHEVY
jgi:hypothetical protein